MRLTIPYETARILDSCGKLPTPIIDTSFFMALFTLGINHTTAPVEIRERIAFTPETLPLALRELATRPHVDEAVIISTCNRTELVLELANDDAIDEVCAWLTTRQAMDDPDVHQRFYRHSNTDALRHLLTVSCGLDSMVLGEPQILGQIKQAYETAREQATVGSALNSLFQYCFAVAKEVRTDTAIGANAVSVASAGVSLARQIFGDFAGHTALLIGAGETIELAAQHLHNRNLSRMIVANRSIDRARELAERYDGFAIHLDELAAHLSDADIVISSTASLEPILTRSDFERAVGGSKRRPVFMLDIAVPRDIEASIGELDDIYLYTIDNLRDVIDDNLRSRESAADDARAIIENRIDHYKLLLKSRDAAPAIQALRLKGETERDKTLAQARNMVASGKSADEALEFLANTLTKRLLHSPTSGLRRAAEDEDLDTLDAARKLFKLDDH